MDMNKGGCALQAQAALVHRSCRVVTGLYDVVVKNPVTPKGAHSLSLPQPFACGRPTACLSFVQMRS